MPLMLRQCRAFPTVLNSFQIDADRLPALAIVCAASNHDRTATTESDCHQCQAIPEPIPIDVNRDCRRQPAFPVRPCSPASLRVAMRPSLDQAFRRIVQRLNQPRKASAFVPEPEQSTAPYAQQSLHPHRHSERRIDMAANRRADSSPICMARQAVSGERFHAWLWRATIDFDLCAMAPSTALFSITPAHIPPHPHARQPRAFDLPISPAPCARATTLPQ